VGKSVTSLEALGGHCGAKGNRQAHLIQEPSVSIRTRLTTRAVVILLCRRKNEVDAWEWCHEKASVLVIVIFLACPTFAVKGRTAAADTDIVMRTEILTDSR
jgi:hypothetical protein